MTYNPATPNSTDLISATQAPIKTNFFQLNQQFGIDHTPYDNGGSNGDGFHKQVTLPTSSTPTATGIQGIFHQTTAGAGEFNGVALPMFSNSSATAHLQIIPNVVTNAISGTNYTGFIYSYRIANLIVNYIVVKIAATSAAITAIIPLPAGYTYTSTDTYVATHSINQVTTAAPYEVDKTSNTTITLTRPIQSTQPVYSIICMGT